MTSGALVQGVPTSVTARLWTPATSDVTSAVTVDATSEIVQADADEGATEIAVSTSTLTKNQKLLLNDDGYTQVVQVREATSGNTIRLTHPLLRAVREDATLVGFSCSITLTAPQTASVGNCSILWTATVNGQVVQWATPFRVVQRLPHPALLPYELARYFPSIMALTPPTDVDLEDAVAAAWEFRILPLLEQKGAFVEDVVSDEALKPLHALAVIRQLYDYDPRIDMQLKDMLRREYAEIVAQTFARVTYFERGQTGNPTPLSPSNEFQRGRTRLIP
jgi:hypothetical protein